MVVKRILTRSVDKSPNPEPPTIHDLILDRNELGNCAKSVKRISTGVGSPEALPPVFADNEPISTPLVKVFEGKYVAIFCRVLAGGIAATGADASTSLLISSSTTIFCGLYTGVVALDSFGLKVFS